MEHAKMVAGACWGVHWIISNMDEFIDRKLQAALLPALTTMQLPVPATIFALPLLPTPYHKDIDVTA